MRIVRGDFGDPRVVALLDAHVATASEATAHGSAHALDIWALQSPDIAFWTIWEADTLLGCGALKRLSAEHGELKSMHTSHVARRRGAGSAMLAYLIVEARGAGLSRLSLETGSWDFFVPARAMYARHGFVACGPFEGYRPDPNSVFMTLELRDQT